MFERLSRWISGEFICLKCGTKQHLMTFGYGDMTCPKCYSGEQPFYYFDDTYWLNRLMMRLIS